MTLTAEALQEVGLAVSPHEVEQVLLTTLREMGIPSPIPDPYKELTEAETDALKRGGLSLEPVQRSGVDDPILRTAATYTSLITTGLSVSQTATLLGVNPSRIRQHLLDHTIYGIKEGHSWRLPL